MENVIITERAVTVLEDDERDQPKSQCKYADETDYKRYVSFVG